MVDENWDGIKDISLTNQQMRVIEKLIHSTKNNEAKYDFDLKFCKMPCYLRRAATVDAIGCVKSYRSNLANWENSGREGRKPQLQSDRYAMPTFFRENMYEERDEPDTANLKLYVNNDWIWVFVSLRHTDVRYLQKHWSHEKASAPTLERRYKKWYLRFAFTEKVELNNTPVREQRICAVDLGLNADAVCSIMDADGTILARKFVNFTSDKDHLYHVLNRIKNYQQTYGSQNVKSFWAYAKRLNTELTRQIAGTIVDFAVLYTCDVIVFEHLDFRGKKAYGNKKQRLHMWCKNSIQDIVEHKAHRCGMRISRICAWNTSKLAYDGSGILERNAHNKTLATFANGKQYNCDLSASYNIGARYFIREISKTISAKRWSQLTAKVPEVVRRTSCTYNTLLQLNAAMVT